MMRKKMRAMLAVSTALTLMLVAAGAPPRPGASQVNYQDAADHHEPTLLGTRRGQAVVVADAITKAQTESEIAAMSNLWAFARRTATAAEQPAAGQPAAEQPPAAAAAIEGLEESEEGWEDTLMSVVNDDDDDGLYDHGMMT